LKAVEARVVLVLRLADADFRVCFFRSLASAARAVGFRFCPLLLLFMESLMAVSPL
jgi:hypothetical protein